MIVVTPLQEPIGTRKITRAQIWKNKATSSWALPIILVFQAAISWIFLQNTIFQDEALYVYAGRQILQSWAGGPAILDNYSYYFSGNPYIYPLIGGALDFLGGTELARSFSLVCMLVVTICGYHITKLLFGQKSAVFAAIFLICQGPILFLSRLATYDPLCICLLAVATLVAVKSAHTQKPWLTLALGPLLVLAFGTKYAALLFIPSIFAILFLKTLFKRGWLSMFIRGGLAVLSFAVAAAIGAYIVLHFDRDMLHALGATTTNRIVTYENSPMSLAIHVLQMVGLSYAVGLASLFFARNKNILLILLFMGTALLIPAYHIYKGELVSLDKHLGFSMFFVMPLAGYTLASLSGFRQNFSSGRYWFAGIAACLIFFMIGVREGQDMFTSWPATDRLSYVLNTQVRTDNGHYLAEQFEVSRYNLRANTANWQWTGLDFYVYTDSHGHYYEGNDAYIHAIQDGHFDLVQLNYGFDAATAQVIRNAVIASKKYELIAKIPYQDSYGSGLFWVWRRQ